MTRVLLVEDHAALRQALALALAMQPDMVVAGQAGSVLEAQGRLAGIDVAIFDLDLVDGDGADLIPVLRRASPRAIALILTGSDRKEDAARAVARGAAGVLHKSVELQDIVEAVRQVAAGESLLSARDTVELVRLAGTEQAEAREVAELFAQLTPREMDVLQALGQGLSDKAIAEQFHLSHETVRTHMVNILGKLGVNSRLQALVLAVRHGVIQIH